MELDHLFEQLLQEATALEVYDQAWKERLTPEEFLAVLRIDPSATVTENPGDASAQATLAQSKKGSYTDWIIRQMKGLSDTAKKRFLEEDAEQLREALSIYKALTQNKEGVAKLEASAHEHNVATANIKDLNQFKTVDMLMAVTSPFKGKETKSLSTQEERQIQVVYNDDMWQVVIPLTHAAARKYGTGTSWCTATGNPQWFRRYSKEGPLFIIRAKKISPPNCRWQYHKESNQFMDYDDDALSPRRFILSHFKYDKEKTIAMAKAIYDICKSPAWDPQRFEKEAAKQIAAIKQAIAESGGDIDEAVIRIGGSKNLPVPVVIAAIRQGDNDLLDTLLNQYHADPVVFDASGTSALTTAIKSNNIDAFKMLLKAGSPETLLSQREGASGACALHTICEALNTTMLNYALEKLPLNLQLVYLSLRDYKRRTPLMYAMLFADEDQEEEVLALTTLITEAYEKANKPLTESIYRLLREAADEMDDEYHTVPAPLTTEKPNFLNLRDLEGHTALSYAYRQGFSKVVHYLQEHGAVVEHIRPAAWKSVVKSPSFFYSFLDNPTSPVVQQALAAYSKPKLEDVVDTICGFTDPQTNFASPTTGAKIAALVDIVLPQYLEYLRTANIRDMDEEDRQDRIQSSLISFLIEAIYKNNLPLIRLLHEKYGADLTYDEDWNTPFKALLRSSEAPSSQLKEIYTYFFQNGITPKTILKTVGGAGIMSLLEDDEEDTSVSFEILQLILEQIPATQYPKLLGANGIKLLIDQYKMKLYGVSEYFDIDDLRTPSPSEIRDAFTQFQSFLEVLINAKVTKSSDAIAAALGGVEDFELANYLISKGFSVDKSDRYFRVLESNFTERAGIYDSDQANDPNLNALIESYKKKFEYVRTTYKCNINAIKQSQNRSVFANLVTAGIRNDALRLSPAFAAWIDQLRSEGALTTTECRLKVAKRDVSTYKFSSAHPSYAMARYRLVDPPQEIVDAETRRLSRSKNGTNLDLDLYEL